MILKYFLNGVINVFCALALTLIILNFILHPKLFLLFIALVVIGYIGVEFFE